MGGIASNPQVQNAINIRPQLPPGVQMPTGLPPSGEAQVYPPYFNTGLPPFDPNNPKGMPPPGGPMQGFNPARPDVGPRPFMGNPQPSMPQQPYNPQQLDAFKQMFQGQPPVQPMNPYEGMTQVGPGSYERLDGSPGSMQPSTSMTPLQKSMMDQYNPQRPQMPQTQPMNPQGSRGTLPYAPTSQEAYNRFLATSKPVQGGSLPSYEQFVQNRLNQPQVLPARPMPGRPMPQFDPRRSGLGALSGLNGVPGNQNPLYFGPGYR